MLCGVKADLAKRDLCRGPLQLAVDLSALKASSASNVQRR